MSMTARQRDFLQHLTHDVRHSGRTLLQHLVGTYDLLRAWDAPEHVCLAGLFHSIYGTAIFKHQTIAPTPQNRDRIADLIGRNAENLAYVFCAAARRRDLSERKNPTDRFAGAAMVLTEQQFDELQLIERANAQEQTEAWTTRDRNSIGSGHGSTQV
jgi:hypothetical protein